MGILVRGGSMWDFGKEGKTLISRKTLCMRTLMRKHVQHFLYKFPWGHRIHIHVHVQKRRLETGVKG